MKRIALFFLIISLTACSRVASATATVPNQEITVSPSPVPTKTSTGTPKPRVTLTELGISDKNVRDAFSGIEDFVTKEESNEFSVTIDGEKYILRGGWSLHPELNNAYAPATVNAVDTDGNSVVLIWNKEGLSVNNPLSIDYDSPTKFSNTSKLTTLQKYLLQYPDPFTNRDVGLSVRTELTESGRVTVLRTDTIPGKNNSRSSEVWLEYTASNGEKHFVNPTEINDVYDRKVIMCAYPNDIDRNNLNEYILHHPDGVKSIVWPVLKADQSFFEKFKIYLSQEFMNAGYLYNLLTQPGNQPEYLPSLNFINVRDFDDPKLVRVGDDVGTPLFGEGYQIPLDKEINGMVLPCVVR